MKIYLIRHGETDWNVKRKIQGSTDIELNDNGISQAKELYKLMKDNKYDISRVYCSKLKRAHDTAKILSEDLNIECIVEEGLEELNLGKWEGFTWKEVEENFQEEFKVWAKDRGNIRCPDGESYSEMLERVLKTIKKIISENTKSVALVTHSAVIMTLQCSLNNIPYEEMKKFRLSNASIVEIDSNEFKTK